MRKILPALLLLSCNTQPPQPEVIRIVEVRQDTFTVNLDLWLECREICGGPGTNWAVNQKFCICRRGLRYMHSKTPDPDEPFEMYEREEIPK